MAGKETADLTPDTSALAQFMATRMAVLGAEAGKNRPLSCREVEARSGGLITAPTVSRYLRGGAFSKHWNRDRIIEGLAKALDVDPAEVEQRIPEDPYGTVYIPPKEAALLTVEQRRLVDGLIKQMARKPPD